jgi:hypothetical protein
VSLVNDFVAAGYGTLTLNDTQVKTLQVRRIIAGPTNDVVPELAAFGNLGRAKNADSTRS